MIPVAFYGETAGAHQPLPFEASAWDGEPYADLRLKDAVQDHEISEYPPRTAMPDKGALKDCDISQEQRRTTEDYPSSDHPTLPKTTSPPFADFLLRRHATNMLTKLAALRTNLGKPEGAILVAQFRDAINEAWNISASLEREKILLVSALEETVRGKKWQELKPQHLKILEQITEILRGQTVTQNQLVKALQLIQKSGMDIFPDADIDEDEEEEEEHSQ